jgi:hypothetical protein
MSRAPVRLLYLDKTDNEMHIVVILIEQEITIAFSSHPRVSSSWILASFPDGWYILNYAIDYDGTYSTWTENASSKTSIQVQ